MTWKRVLFDELKNLPGLELHVLVLRKQIQRSETLAYGSAVFHLLKVPGGLRAPSFFWVDTFLFGRVLNRIRPDVVHAWGTERGAALVAARLTYPYVVTIQGLLSWYAERVPLRGHDKFAALLERLSVPRAPVVTTESTFAVQYLKQKWPHLRIMQAEHASNWVFHRVQRRPQCSPFRFLFVGVFGYRKGADLLLDALEKLKSEFAFELVVIGRMEPEGIARLRASTSAELRGRIQFRQNLSPEEVADELAVATMLLFPTRADTSPNAVKESVVAGMPVVASAVGGIVDYVFPGVNGFTFPSENAEEFVRAIRAACVHPLFSRGLVEPASLSKTRDYLSPRRMGERFLEAYQRALEIKGRGPS
jgi:glycosyltransferase involved in cell wall biosynthesis